MKRWILLILVLQMSLVGCSKESGASYDSLLAEYNSTKEMVEDLRSDYDSLSEKYDKLKTDYDTLKTEKDAVEAEYQQYKNSSPATTGQPDAYAQQQAQAQMWEIAQAYETGITYEIISGDTSQYVSQKLNFKGQIVDGNTDNNLLTIVVAVDQNPQKLLIMQGSLDLTKETTIEVGANVAVYGTFAGQFDYTDKSGKNWKIPGASLEYVILQ